MPASPSLSGDPVVDGKRPVHLVDDVAAPDGAAPELLTFLDAAHRRIAELEVQLAELRRRHGDPPARGHGRLGRSA